jgi:hypothetical protein
MRNTARQTTWVTEFSAAYPQFQQRESARSDSYLLRTNPQAAAGKKKPPSCPGGFVHVVAERIGDDPAVLLRH